MLLIETQKGTDRISTDKVIRFYTKRNKVCAELVERSEPHILGTYKNKERADEVLEEIKNIPVFKMPKE